MDNDDKLNKNDNFVTEVAKYFMNFLETDFHKTRLPKRNSISKIVKGYKVGLDLEKYKKLKKDFYTIFYNGFKKDSINVKKGTYTSSISDNIFKLISSKVKSLDEELLNVTFAEIEANLKEIKKVHIKNYQLYLENSQDTIQTILTKHFIVPFLDTIEEPLQTLELVDQNGLYQIEGELSDSLYSVFDNIIVSILQSYFEYDQILESKELKEGEKEKKFKPFKLLKELKENILIDELKANIELFFKNISISDAFDDIYILFKNNKLLDKTELYLYMYEISAGKHTFPLFYLPIKLEEKKGSFELIFDQKLYVNTKAIDYVVQEYNRETPDSAGTLAGNYDRIIYINDDDNFIEKVKWISDSVQNFFKFNKILDSENSEFQKAEHILTSFSNKSYIYLFDKSDESVINDYEEILNNEEGILYQFSLLLNDFVESNPINFEEEIHDSWEERSVSSKLIFESPIPLNDEQKQVVIALENPECKVLTLEGPPGTGKSHTITAIICKALLNAKSVLVLSDKKEALDVVEEKITETLNKVRKDDDFLNPILRLGKSGNKFGKIVQGQTINKIAEHYSAYKHKKSDLDKEKNNLLKIIENNIENNINYFSDISIPELRKYYNSLKEYENINWYNSKDELEVNLLDLKKSINNINNLNFSSEINQELLGEENFNIYSKYIKILRNIAELNNTFSGNNSTFDFENIILEDSELKLDSKYHEDRGISLNIMKESIEKLNEIFEADEELVNHLYEINFNKKETYTNTFDILTLIKDLIPKSKKYLGEDFNNYNIFKYFELEDFNNEETLNEFDTIVQKIIDYKRPIIGYLFQDKKLEREYKNIKDIFPYFDSKKIGKIDENIDKAYDLLKFILEQLSEENNKDRKIFIKQWNLLLYTISNEIDVDTINNLSKIVLDTYNEYELPSINFEVNFGISSNEWYLNLSRYIEELRKLSYKLIGLIPYELTDSKKVFVNFKGDQNIYREFDEVSKLKEYTNDLNFIESLVKKYSILCKNINLNYSKENVAEINSDLNDYDNSVIESYINFKKLHFKISDQFNNFPEDLFSDGIKNIEEQTTAEMAYFLDKRIVEYTRNYSKEVNTLKGIISKKKKFPKGLFKNLKNAFPCILAGIRDYSDYIPLEKDLFDLIIIDEASQVSIAQSLPALIRGKKIIILGDDKQFSNVKSNNASKIVNQEYKTSVKRTFIEERLAGKEDEYGWLENVGNFDIKYSILKFSKSIQNYKCQLRKHFRGYPEIISYSNKFFYDGSLQCMKIRGKSIEDVIKIDVIPHDGLIDTTKNTNELEVDFIIKKILEFKSKGIEQSLGIITPHQHQAGLLHDKINELEDKDWIFKACKLKIMTFDSCQGEERDYIFYSMVATEEKDRLIYIFIKDLNSIDTEEDGSVKAQRMNVGFSRAKECMHFILSKPINSFNGEIKNALLHYQNELEAGKKVNLGGTDENSPMEKKIQEYFYETQFYKDNNKSVEFIPQFDIGKYLRQLDRTYNHPAYKVDFLLIYNNKKVVIEYDGFKEHFEDLGSVDKYNYESYMKSDDIYRQKVLEGYGYKFLRINRFNIGDNPVETLDNRLNELFKKKRLNNEALEEFHDQIDKLHDGDERACISCSKISDSKYFPYKTKDQCVNCYEKENGKTLWTFRQRLNYYEKNGDNLDDNDESSEIKLTSLNCPTCNSNNVKSKGYRNDKKRLLCGDCGRNWSVLLEDVVNNTVKSVISKKEDTFERENTIEEIRDYLKVKESSGSPVSIYYREKDNMDTFDNYYFDDTYLHVKTGNSRYYIKYLIDKIRKVV